MARQPVNTKPYIKHMEAYNNFAGGMNTTSASASLQNNEFQDLVNVDLSERGSARRRKGMSSQLRPSKNIIPKFARWTRPAGATINSDYSLTVTSGIAEVIVPILPSTAYFMSQSAGVFDITFLTNSNAEISSIHNPSSFITPGTAYKMRVRTYNTGTYTNLQCEKGTVQTAFAPSVYPEGIAQGYFRFFKTDGTMEEIVAISGKLYNANGEMTITGLASFQETRQIEAVQFKGKMYFATGTKLVEYDGTTAKVVEAYKPEALEALYIGTNGLADNPDQFISDSTSAYVQVTGITASKRYGVANTETVFTAYVAKPTDATVEYKWEYQVAGASEWTAWPLHTDYTANQKQFNFKVGTGDYSIRCLARKQGEADPFNYSEYQIPKYTVNETDQNKTENISTIHTCNRILVHWQRIILYGDTTNKDMIYVSDIDRPNYFPTLNTLRFENTRQEEITALVEFRDMLIAFTPNTIQALFGKSPQDFSRIMLSSSIGCIAPYSAEVMENYVVFLSNEGVYILKTLGYTEQRANVQKIDTKIDNIVPRHTDACGIIVDGQYQLTFPKEKKRLRFYYQDAVWTKDESEKLTFVRNYEWNGVYYGLTATGAVLKHDATKLDDDGYIYRDIYTFKDYDFSEPYSVKKLKELQIFISNYGQPINISVTIHIDGSAILTTDQSYAKVDESGNAVWVNADMPNLSLPAGTSLGSWVLGESPFGGAESQLCKMKLSGKGRRIQLEISHEEAKDHHILGLGFIFKSKGV